MPLIPLRTALKRRVCSWHQPVLHPSCVAPMSAPGPVPSWSSTWLRSSDLVSCHGTGLVTAEFWVITGLRFDLLAASGRRHNDSMFCIVSKVCICLPCSFTSLVSQFIFPQRATASAAPWQLLSACFSSFWGPNNEPCSTGDQPPPGLTSFTVILWAQPSHQFFPQWIVQLSKTWAASFPARILWKTVSNALLKPRQTSLMITTSVQLAVGLWAADHCPVSLAIHSALCALHSNSASYLQRYYGTYQKLI